MFWETKCVCATVQLGGRFNRNWKQEFTFKELDLSSCSFLMGTTLSAK